MLINQKHKVILVDTTELRQHFHRILQLTHDAEMRVLILHRQQLCAELTRLELTLKTT